MMSSPLNFDETTGRYEMTEDGAMVYAKTHLKEDVLYIDYVEAANELRGTGAAGRFMELLIGEARNKGLNVKPICGYAGSWLRKNKQHHDILISD